MEEAGVGRKERNLDAARGATATWFRARTRSLCPRPSCLLLCCVQVWKKDLCESRLVLLHQRAERLKTTITGN